MFVILESHNFADFIANYYLKKNDHVYKKKKNDLSLKKYLRSEIINN
jgi:hypothetical protein